jgi:hypothetical protein
MAIITKELAGKITKKLKAQVETTSRRAHDLARVYDDEGLLVASFGLRRGSKKNLGHDHIPERLHLSKHDARLLGQCPLTRQGWLDILREKGLA